MTALSRPIKRTCNPRTKLPHGFADTLILTLYPGGILGVREARHREELTLDVADWYARTLTRRALEATRKRRIR